ncbi:hypothetical protein [Streptomyces lavenduligriseus]|uniref:Uncharacterized protein n=1 Tax=Streptomyces lavenduligriseus TaxID=67315 RepID=A0ABT0NVB4_9ACTN|nr:hypothetical protein [Streptomyces lavenduligriseus]MCL3994732.1 hypothetical protein [Streptomyces lavenduligriseus]
MRRNRMKLGALVGGLIAAVLAFGAVATMSHADEPGSKHPTAAVTMRPW